MQNRMQFSPNFMTYSEGVEFDPLAKLKGVWKELPYDSVFETYTLYMKQTKESCNMDGFALKEI